MHRAPLDELATHYAEAEVKGEIVIVVGPPAEAGPVDEQTVERELLALLGEHTTKDAAAIVAARCRLPRREIYALALKLSRGRGP